VKARFDEYRNIGWSRSLEQAGVHRLYGFPNLKIHAKRDASVVRREKESELRGTCTSAPATYNILTAAPTRTTGFHGHPRSRLTSPTSSTS